MTVKQCIEIKHMWRGIRRELVEYINRMDAKKNIETEMAYCVTRVSVY